MRLFFPEVAQKAREIIPENRRVASLHPLPDNQMEQENRQGSVYHHFPACQIRPLRGFTVASGAPSRGGRAIPRGRA
jgi:hypothetical protein